MNAKPKFFNLIENAGRFSDLVAKLIKYAKKHKLSDDEFAKLFTDEGESKIEGMVLSLKDTPVEKKPEPPKPPEHVPTIRNKQRIIIDRTTPLEDQFAALAKEGKIRGDWWRELISAHYPSDTSRPTEITLGECNVGRTIIRDENAQTVVANMKGVVRNGDPYELCAWLRAMPKAGLEYLLAALDTLWLRPGNRYHCAPCAHEVDGERHVNGGWIEHGWNGAWFFLVVCE